MIASRTDRVERRIRIAAAMEGAEKRGKLGWDVVVLLAPRSRGREFPIDVLRYSNGRPASESQSGRIERSIRDAATGRAYDRDYEPEPIAVRFYAPTKSDLRSWLDQMAERASAKFSWEIVCGRRGHEVDEVPDSATVRGAALAVSE